MNCLVFKDVEELNCLKFSDYRAEHIKKYLKAKSGDILYVALINSFLAKAVLTLNEGFYSFEICEKVPCAPLRNIEIAVALARPQIAQSILFDCACLGVSKVNFYIANKSEASYANSSLYAKNEYLNYLIRGAEQACNCFLPEFEIHQSLKTFLENSNKDEVQDTLLIAPDLYEAQGDFAQITESSNAKKALLIMGAERGFNEEERLALREHNVTLALMRERVMRTDTALVYALGLLHKI